MPDRPAHYAADMPADQSSITDYLDVREYLRIVYRRRWLIVGMLTIGLVSALAINWTTTPVYEAQATLQIDMDPNVLGLDRPLLPVDQRDWMREFLPTQLGILESSDLARAAQQELARTPSAPAAKGNPGAPNESAVAASAASGVQRVPTAGEIMAGRSVSIVKDTRLVNVAFRSTDPALTARVANALARVYVQQNVDVKSKTNVDASAWLAKEVDDQRKVVKDSEAALQRYRTEHGADALFTDKLGVEQQNIVVQKLAALQAAVTKARTDTIEREARFRQLVRVQANHEPLDSVPAIAANSYIQGLKTEVATLQRQMGQASKELGERHPDYIKLSEAVQNAERKLQAEITKEASAIRNDFEAAQATERSLVAALDRQKSEVQALNGKTIEYTALEREANSNREGLDKLLVRLREASLASHLQTTNARIMDWAQVPQSPILPRKTRTLVTGVVGSGALSLIIIFVIELFNTRVLSPEDVKRHLRIQVLGVIPEVNSRAEESPLLGNGAPVQFAELFQSLRTSLVTAPELADGRTLLVTSSEPGEGKSVTAANVAVSLAALKQRVLLIDGDLRKPRLHDIFGESQYPGLADVLQGHTTTADFRKTKIPGLWLMPAGRAIQNPANLLGSDNFGKLIGYFRKHFDWIVLDSPPVLAVTDPCLIARAASGVLLVVDSRRTVREVASAAVERLEAVGATIVGAMLNRVVLKARAVSYLPYYHQDYETYFPQVEDRFHPPQISASASSVEGSGAAEATTFNH